MTDQPATKEEQYDQAVNELLECRAIITRIQLGAAERNYKVPFEASVGLSMAARLLDSAIEKLRD